MRPEIISTLAYEVGLTNRIISNISAPDTRAFAATHLSSLHFGDIQTAMENPLEIPDIVLLSVSPSNAIIVLVGESKPFWNVDLHGHPVTASMEPKR